ncbi:TIGR00341 family protein [Haloplanus rubicundus]|uniref:TIGR00341 family protein n=1 Tax=Haloplanus rubicundus TaxID=1547898 RepID=UPI0013003C3A|nr:TIGR00341 family protein [Haloplanus rubicundus]
MEEKNVDFVLTPAESPQNYCVVEFPLPVGAVEDILNEVRDQGIDVGKYTVVTSLETATTQNLAELEEEYVEDSSDIKRISHAELRVEAQEHKPHIRTFIILSALSAMVAAAGLLLNSAVVITGAMVLAPFLSTIVSGSVGLTIDDRSLIVDSMTHQPMGLGTAIVGAGVAGFLFRILNIIPANLYLRSIDQIHNFSTPNALIVTIAVIAGVAVALTVAADISSAFAGIAVAAAIVPSAATIGLGLVWQSPSVAFGALVLLLINVATINVVSFLTFFALGYRSEVLRYIQPGLTLSLRTTGTVVVILITILVLGFTTITTYQYVAFDQTVNHEVEEALDRPTYTELSLVEIRTENQLGLFNQEPRVTIVVASNSNHRYPALPSVLQQEIESNLEQSVQIRVQIINYRTPGVVTNSSTQANSIDQQVILGRNIILPTAETKATP